MRRNCIFWGIFVSKPVFVYFEFEQTFHETDQIIIFFFEIQMRYIQTKFDMQNVVVTLHMKGRRKTFFFAHFSSFVNTWQTVPVVFVLHSYAFVYILTKFSGNSLSEHTRIFLLIMCGIDSIIHLSYTYWIRI